MENKPRILLWFVFIKVIEENEEGLGIFITYINDIKWKVVGWGWTSYKYVHTKPESQFPSSQPKYSS